MASTVAITVSLRPKGSLLSRKAPTSPSVADHSSGPAPRGMATAAYHALGSGADLKKASAAMITWPSSPETPPVGMAQPPRATPPAAARSSTRGSSPENHPELARRSSQPTPSLPTPNNRHPTPANSSLSGGGGQYSGLAASHAISDTLSVIRSGRSFKQTWPRFGDPFHRRSTIASRFEYSR